MGSCEKRYSKFQLPSWPGSVHIQCTHSLYILLHEVVRGSTQGFWPGILRFDILTSEDIDIGCNEGFTQGFIPRVLRFDI